MNKKLYFENLDGLRFICFLSVFFFHSFHTESIYIKDTFIYHFIKEEVFNNGNLGVNFFFVLSGFLITTLLIHEKEINGQINIKKFWFRRVLRIWPLFYFCVFFGFIIFPQLKLIFGQASNETATPLYYMVFFNNFDFIQKGLPDASVLGVLWSVAIEEQFYLVWPIIIYVFSIKKLWIPFIIIIAATLIFRASYDEKLLHEYHTLSCIGDMTIGAIGAWIIFSFQTIKNKIENFSRIKIATIYVSALVIYIFREEILFANYGIRIFERSIIAVVFLLIILEQNYSKNSFFKLSNYKTISRLGIISYGLYCLHFIGILIVITLTNKWSINTELWQVMVLETSLALLITIVISQVSYKYFETPFLKIKEKFSYIKK